MRVMSKQTLLRILAIGLGLLSTTPMAAQRVPSGTIAGQVVTQDGERPLAARVWLVGAARPGAQNPRGTFRFDGLLPGRYHLRATFIGYVPFDTVLVVRSGATARLVVRLAASPVQLSDMTIREVATPPPPPPRPAPPPRPPVDCGLLMVVGSKAMLCTSAELLPRATVLRDREFLGPNTLIRAAAQSAVTQAGFVPERLLQLDDRTWLITARDPTRPVGLGSVRIEVEETGAHDTTVRISLTSATFVSTRSQLDRAQAYLTGIRRILGSR